MIYSHWKHRNVIYFSTELKQQIDKLQQTKENKNIITDHTFLYASGQL